MCISLIQPVLAGTNVAIGSAIGMQFKIHNLLAKKIPMLCKSVIITVAIIVNHLSCLTVYHDGGK